jgi:hypothetical protein
MQTLKRLVRENWFPIVVLLVMFGPPAVMILLYGKLPYSTKQDYPTVPPNHMMIVTSDDKGRTKVTLVPNEVAKDFFHNPTK